MISSPVPLTAVLLAGGKSTRMGRDKATLEIEGVPLWQRQLAVLRELRPAEILIAGPSAGPWADAGVNTIADALPDAGPLGALAAVLTQTPHRHVLALAVDLPAMTPAYLRTLLAQCAAGRGRVPRLGGRFEPLAAIYPKAMAELATRALGAGERSLQPFIQSGLDAGLLDVDEVSEGARDLFRNVNTPADLATRP